MKMMVINFLTLAGLLLLSPSCKKSQPNSFESSVSATVNGQAWHNSSCTSCIGGFTGIVLSYESNTVVLTAEMKTSSNDTFMDLVIKQVSGPGQYIISDSNYADFRTSSGIIIINYKTDVSHTGIVNITRFDTVNHIISGTFQFDGANQANSADVTHVTSGSFAVSYPLP